jgi:hypothetical protein
MSQLPDVSCLIKVIANSDGKTLPDGGAIFGQLDQATLRYVVVNHSDKPAGPLFVVGSLFRNGVRVQPNGQPNIIPSQQITLQPKQLWKREFPISEGTFSATYKASLLADVGNFVHEEDESNNSVKTSFQIVTPPR